LKYFAYSGSCSTVNPLFTGGKSNSWVGGGGGGWFWVVWVDVWGWVVVCICVCVCVPFTVGLVVSIFVA